MGMKVVMDEGLLVFELPEHKCKLVVNATPSFIRFIPSTDMGSWLGGVHYERCAFRAQVLYDHGGSTRGYIPDGLSLIGTDLLAESKDVAAALMLGAEMTSFVDNGRVVEPENVLAHRPYYTVWDRDWLRYSW